MVKISSKHKVKMSTVELVPRIHYLVALGYVILDRPGENYDEHYVEMIGSFEAFDDAKQCVDEHAGLIMDNDEQYLSIYKIDLNQCKVQDYHRADIPEAVQQALKEQKEEEAKRSAERKQRVQDVMKRNTTSPLLKIEKVNAEGTSLGNVPVNPTHEQHETNEGENQRDGN